MELLEKRYQYFIFLIKKNFFISIKFSLGRYDGNPYEMTDWQIMIHIIQGRDLPGLELNPYVVIQIDNQKRSTHIHKSSNSPYFGEVKH
jgi:hypothetical protein